MGEHVLFEALKSGATGLTANKRLARELLVRYEHWQESRGAQVWETPDVLAQQVWLARSHDEQLTSGMGDGAALARLPEAAERLMWERIIADAEAQAPLLHVPQAAAAAQEAYGLTLAWRLH